MAARSLSAVSLATILAFTIPSLASAGELRLVFNNGRVTLMARDVSLQDILVEWERVGGTRVVNRDAVSGPPISLDLVDVTEAHALATVLRSAAGYLAFARTAPADAASRFVRIVIMPGEERLAAGPQVAAGPPSSGTMAGPGPWRPQVQQRIMPDSRVLTPTEGPVQPSDEPSAADARGAEPPQEEPFVAVPGPPRFPPEPAGVDPSQSIAPGVQGSGSQAPQSTRATPTVGDTAALPGTVIPAPKVLPPPYTPQTYPRQTTPPKPPGI